MNKYLTIISIPALAFSTNMYANTQTTLSFAEAWNLALQHSAVIKTATIETSIAAMQQAIANYDNNPTVTFQSGIQRKVREGESTNSVRSSAFDQSTEQQHAINLTIPIYDFGRATARERIRELDFAIAQTEQSETNINLQFKIGRLFINSAAAQRNVQIAREQLRIAEIRAKEQDRLYHLGLRPESDVIAARVDLGSAEINLRQMEADALTARQSLNDAIGLPEELSRNLANPAPLSTNFQAIEPLFLSYVNGPEKPNAKEHRNKLLEQQIDAASDEIRADRRPKLTGTLSAQGIGNLNPVKPQASAGLSLFWEIPWSGQHRDRQHLNEQRRAFLQQQNNVDQLLLTGQWRNAQQQLQATQKLIQTLQDQAILLERQHKLMIQRYNTGKSSALELSFSEAALINSQKVIVKINQQAIAALIDAAESRGETDLQPLFKKVLN